MELQIDFIKDWRDHLLNKLKILGIDTSRLKEDEDEIFCIYYETMNRRILPKKRTIKISNCFVCPQKHEEGWKKIQLDVSTGKDITPHLSVGINKRPTIPDQMLNDWGVYHLHLGKELDSKNPDFIKRTGPILFAAITEDFFYAINIYPHNDWCNNTVLNIINNNWPEILSEKKVDSTFATSLSTDAIKTLRRRNSNVVTTLADGTSYLAIGGGLMVSGMNMKARIICDTHYRGYKQIQNDFTNNTIYKIIPELKKRGYRDAMKLVVTLKISDNELKVYFPDFSYEVVIR